jgi:hypothetical protein
MAGHGPVATDPVYASDEDIFIICTGDFGIIAPPSQQLAFGNDGYFNVDDQWRLNSPSNNFQAQGVRAQNIIWLQGPSKNYPGSGIFMAVDSAAGTSIVLRRPMQPLNMGMPPSPAAGLTGVTFSIQTLYPQIEEASYQLKHVKFMIDEAIGYRSSFWMYQGVEDPYRVLRRLCVLQVLVDRYTTEVREERGDFELKLRNYANQFKDLRAQVQVKWGPMGNSAEPMDIFSTKVSR